MIFNFPSNHRLQFLELAPHAFTLFTIFQSKMRDLLNLSLQSHVYLDSLVMLSEQDIL